VEASRLEECLRALEDADAERFHIQESAISVRKTRSIRVT
jgi:hypothetical protein